MRRRWKREYLALAFLRNLGGEGSGPFILISELTIGLQGNHCRLVAALQHELL